MSIKHLGLKLRLWLVLPALALLTVLCLGGCTVARMALPEPLMAQTDEMPVTGRQGFNWGKDVTFGDYRLTDISRGWVSGHSISILFWSASEAHRKYRFTMVSPHRNEGVEVACVTNARMQELDFGGRSWQLNLDLNSESITVSDFYIDDEFWTVILAANETTGQLTTGVITNGTRRIDIESTRSLQGAAYDVPGEVGFFFRENDGYIGAAENINDGAVFMLQSLDNFTRDILAIGSGVIFIYEDVLRRP